MNILEFYYHVFTEPRTVAFSQLAPAVVFIIIWVLNEVNKSRDVYFLFYLFKFLNYVLNVAELVNVKSECITRLELELFYPCPKFPID